MATDRKIGFIDGLALTVGIILFTGYQVYRVVNSKKNSRNQTQNVLADNGGNATLSIEHGSDRKKYL